MKFATADTNRTLCQDPAESAASGSNTRVNASERASGPPCTTGRRARSRTAAKRPRDHAPKAELDRPGIGRLRLASGENDIHGRERDHDRAVRPARGDPNQLGRTDRQHDAQAVQKRGQEVRHIQPALEGGVRLAARVQRCDQCVCHAFQRPKHSRHTLEEEP